jgi:hypothetical protein
VIIFLDRFLDRLFGPQQILYLDPVLAADCQREARQFCRGMAVCSGALLLVALVVGFWWLALAGALLLAPLDLVCWRALTRAWQPLPLES